MEDRKIIRAFPRGDVTPPPSKSVSHRGVICGALAALDGGGESELRGIALSQDIEATLGGIEALGCRRRLDGGALYIRGGGVRREEIDCGESGSTLRFLIPVAALAETETVFTGRGRLMERPMKPYIDAGIPLEQSDGRIAVRGPLRAGVYVLPGDVSSQFVSGLLFALPLLREDSEIRLTSPLESRAYVDLTIDMMGRFGVTVLPTETGYRVPGGQRYRPATVTVEADYSQAAFFLGAAALGREVRCRGLLPDSIQGDRAILDILRSMGARVSFDGDAVTVAADRLRPITVDAREIPDLIPPVAALCCFCDGVSHIVGAGRLRYKESDRLHALASELSKLGARVEEGPDSLTIRGAERLPGGRADAWGDHRIAMALAVAAIRCDGPVELTGASSVRKSYPNFWEEFEKEERHG